MPLLNRREFLASSAAASAVLFAGCVPPSREVEGESRVLLAEDILSAYDNWYASTCRGCDAGCGIVARVVDGRARKVEGNPDHPLNQGKLCARGQALVQEQYHPDRLQGPLQRDPAERGSDMFHNITWSAGLDALATRLRDIRAAGQSQQVALITPPLAAHQAFLVDRFSSAYGLDWFPFEPVSEAPLRAAVRRVFGFDQVPWFDVANAHTVLSFGADFLGGWLSPVRFGVEYGNFRQGSYAARSFQPRPEPRPRGRLIHVDSHFSTTAASADEWVWVRPGLEGVLALSIAQALGATGLDQYAAEQTATATGVSADRARRVAAELRNATPSLVIGGGLAGAHTQGTDALSAILQLNVLLDNVGHAGGVLPSPAPPIAGFSIPASARPLADWQALVERMRSGQVQAVVTLGGADPVYGLPSGVGFAGALQHVPFVVSLNSFADDTTLHADLVLPSSLPLEDWGDAVPLQAATPGVLSVQQPVVQALFDTRSAWDVLLALADDLGDTLHSALPWPTYKDLLQDQLGQLNTSGDNPQRFWRSLLQHGVVSAPPSATPAPASMNLSVTDVPEPQFAGDARVYPFNLLVFAHNTLGAGGSAHLPWLQAAPDPVTSVTWQTWVELNPNVAASLGVSEGDIVSVGSPRGDVEVPVYISPAAPPDVVSMPLGQGHADSGRWARRRGTNPLALLEPLADAATGALAYGATRVRLTKTGRHMPLPKLEGSAPARQLPGQEVIQILHE